MSNQQPQPQQKRKFSPCYRKCGTLVTYDEAHMSQSGKHIPMVVDATGQLQKHDCPNFNKQQPQPQQASQQQTSPSLSLQAKIDEIRKELRANYMNISKLIDELQQQSSITDASHSTAGNGA